MALAVVETGPFTPPRLVLEDRFEGDATPACRSTILCNSSDFGFPPMTGLPGRDDVDSRAGLLDECLGLETNGLLVAGLVYVWVRRVRLLSQTGF